jgi:predicted enzyme related to lactoylglutathione lyase
MSYKKMKIKYKHTNIIARDWQRLVKFYQDVFGCIRIPPERNLSGLWLEKGTGVKDACFSGVHLHLPGYAENGPTLEIYQYIKNEDKPSPAANREGFGHIAFEVDDVTEMMEKVLNNGGNKMGDIVTSPVPGEGVITFVYLTDPEGNIIELQSWR